MGLSAASKVLLKKSKGLAVGALSAHTVNKYRRRQETADEYTKASQLERETRKVKADSTTKEGRRIMSARLLKGDAKAHLGVKGAKRLFPRPKKGTF